MSSFQIPNPSSLTESTTTMVFPAAPDIQKNIPLYMKFFCFEYSKSAIGRSEAYRRSRTGQSIPAMTNIKSQIFIPAPSLFTSTTQHSYKAEPSDIGLIGILPSSGYFTKNFTEQITWLKKQRIRLKTAASVIRGGYGQDIPMDVTDMVYQPGGQVRSYEIQAYLPCLTIEDSKKAGDIIKSFEALSLPTMIGLGISSLSIMFHPPLWMIGIGPPDTLQVDPHWSGAPQLSVLRTVKSKRVALETNTLAAIGGQTPGAYKPIAYTLTLLFQELEPAVRITNPGAETSSFIGSRSIGMVSTGSSAIAKASNP